MFVESKETTCFEQRNGIALRQRRGHQETLVQWQNGDQRWVTTSELKGEIRLVGENEVHDEQ